MPISDRHSQWDRSWALLAALATLLWCAAVVMWTVQDGRDASFDPAKLAMRIDLNSADSSTLQLLPGIGPKLAGQIVAERDNQPFNQSEDLLRISGIGRTTLDRISPYIICSSRPPFQQ